MRIRTMMLAGLAPLFGLSALATSLWTGPVWRASLGIAAGDTAAGPLPSLLQPVLPLLASVMEEGDAAARVDRPSAQALLTLEALEATAFRGSLWLLSSVVAVCWFARRHYRRPLRS